MTPNSKSQVGDLLVNINNESCIPARHSWLLVRKRQILTQWGISHQALVWRVVLQNQPISGDHFYRRIRSNRQAFWCEQLRRRVVHRRRYCMLYFLKCRHRISVTPFHIVYVCRNLGEGSNAGPRHPHSISWHPEGICLWWYCQRVGIGNRWKGMVLWEVFTYRATGPVSTSGAFRRYPCTSRDQRTCAPT